MGAELRQNWVALVAMKQRYQKVVSFVTLVGAVIMGDSKHKAFLLFDKATQARVPPRHIAEQLDNATRWEDVRCKSWLARSSIFGGYF